MLLTRLLLCGDGVRADSAASARCARDQAALCGVGFLHGVTSVWAAWALATWTSRTPSS